MRRIITFCVLLLHFTLAALAGILPDTLAALMAGSVYLPLHTVAATGLPVFQHAESMGWPAPSLIGWLFAMLLWSGIWWMVVCGTWAAARQMFR